MRKIVKQLKFLFLEIQMECKKFCEKPHKRILQEGFYDWFVSIHMKNFG
jgi:hypothetical protein